MASLPLSVICIKVGTKYGAEYVNKLKGMVERHLTVPHEFVCITDDPTGLNCTTMPVEEDLPGWWSKLTLFRKRAYGLKKVLFLDLDVVITDNIDCFITEDDFVIINDWNVPGYNSSVFLLRIGSQTQVWHKFDKSPKRIMKRYHGDQDWITIHAEEVKCWPEGWCVSYKRTPLPVGRISVFHGDPKPHTLGGWVQEHWRE